MSAGSLLEIMHRLDLHLQARIDTALRAAGITAAQWRALDAAIAAPGSSSAELARSCGVTAQTMQALIVTLERDGLIVRRPHPIHGRVQQVYVSNAGEERHREGSDTIAAVELRLLAAFTEEETREFERLLDMAVATLDRPARLHRSGTSSI